MCKQLILAQQINSHCMIVKYCFICNDNMIKNCLCPWYIVYCTKSTVRVCHFCTFCSLKRNKKCSCGSVVEHWVSSAKVVGSIPREHILTKMYNLYCKSLWIKASAKCINVRIKFSDQFIPSKFLCIYYRQGYYIVKDLILKCKLFCFKNATMHLCCVLNSFYTHSFIILYHLIIYSI